MKKFKTTIGPVQLLVLGFPPEISYEGKILRELERLDRVKTIRILDLLFVKRDKETNDVAVLSIQGEKLGTIIGELMGLDLKKERTKSRKTNVDIDGNAFGFSLEQIHAIGQSLDPGMAASILLIEHMWAKDLKQAVRETGGVPLAEGFLTPEVITTIATELTERSETIDQVEQEEKERHAKMATYN